MNTNALSLTFLRATGWMADIVQRQQRGFRRDLFGLADILAFRAGKEETMLVNACTTRDVKAHQDAYASSPHLSALISVPTRTFWLHAWTRVKPRGRKPFLVMTPWKAVNSPERWIRMVELSAVCRMDGKPIG